MPSLVATSQESQISSPCKLFLSQNIHPAKPCSPDEQVFQCTQEIWGKLLLFLLPIHVVLRIALFVSIAVQSFALPWQQAEQGALVLKHWAVTSQTLSVRYALERKRQKRRSYHTFSLGLVFAGCPSSPGLSSSLQSNSRIWTH